MTPAPSIYVALIAGQQQPDAKTIDGTPVRIGAVSQFTGLGYGHGESPAIDAAIPATATLTADGSVEPNICGDDPAVFRCPLAPSIDILQRPGAVLILLLKHVGV